MWLFQLQKDPKQFKKVNDETLISLREEARLCYEAEVTNKNLSTVLLESCKLRISRIPFFNFRKLKT